MLQAVLRIKLLTRETPRRNDLDARCQSVERKLESDLIVSLASATMGDGAGHHQQVARTLALGSLAIFPRRDLDHSTGDNWTGKGCAKEIDVLIDGITLHRGWAESAPLLVSVTTKSR